jgi:hypothetical protein
MTLRKCLSRCRLKNVFSRIGGNYEFRLDDCGRLHLLTREQLCQPKREQGLNPVATAPGSVLVDPQCKNSGLMV